MNCSDITKRDEIQQISLVHRGQKLFLQYAAAVVGAEVSDNKYSHCSTFTHSSEELDAHA